MVCLTASGRPMVRWKNEVYKLTVAAREELMGAPIGFTAHIKLNGARERASGDGIVVPVSKAIGLGIRHVLEAAR